MTTDERVCPDCAETIKAAAKVCKHCGYRLEEEAAVIGAAIPPTDTLAASPPPSAPSAPPAPPAPPLDIFCCPSCDRPTPEKMGVCQWCHKRFSDGKDTGNRIFDMEGMSKGGCIAIVVGTVVGAGLLASFCSMKPTAPAVEPASTPMPTSEAAYTADQLSMICRAGIAAEFGRDPLTMTTKPIDTGLVRVEYRRPDDNSLWKNDCRIEGNRIVWRTVDTMPGSGPGRWRTTENDDVLTFKLEGRSVTTESSDGSSANETYRF